MAKTFYTLTDWCQANCPGIFHHKEWTIWRSADFKWFLMIHPSEDDETRYASIEAVAAFFATTPGKLLGFVEDEEEA